MLLKNFLTESTKKLAANLKNDIQYKSLSKKEILAIARKEMETFLLEKKKWSQTQLFLKENKNISPQDRALINVFIQKRKKGVPLAYIMKKAYFYGLEMEVNKNTLIPRPETEELVEYALQRIKNKKNKKIILVDVGTGSGCVLAAFLKNVPRKTNFQAIYAVDPDTEALKIARKNIKKTVGKSQSVKFRLGSLLQPVPQKFGFHYFLLANLPYVGKAEFKNLSREVGKWEPQKALLGGKFGHEIILELLKEVLAFKKRSTSLAKSDSQKTTFDLILELSPTVLPKILSFCSQNHLKTRIVKDLSQKDRILHVFFE